MNILHVTRESGSDARYGIGKSLAPVVTALRARGHTVEILDGDMARAHPIGRWSAWLGRCLLAMLRWYYAPPGPDQAASQAILAMLAERTRIAWIAARWVKAKNISHIHCHDPVLAYLYACFARWTGAKARWGVTEHGFGAYVQERPGVPIPQRLLVHFQAWERSVAQSANWLCAPSQAGLWQLASDLRWPAGTSAESAPLPHNWHAVLHPRPALRQYERAKARQLLGIAADAWVVLAVGQLIPMKRFPLLITACGSMDAAMRPDLIILGEGDKAPLLQAAEAMGMLHKLRIEVTDDIGLYFSAADVYASSTATESFGMANCEALSFGLPAVCTAVGAVPEIMGDAAWLVGDAPDEMAAALTALCNDPDLRRSYCEKARQWAQAWPDPEKIAAEMERIYDGAIRAYSGGRTWPVPTKSARPLKSH